jgi:5-deoxy-D-glucuronate isomerase
MKTKLVLITTAALLLGYSSAWAEDEALDEVTETTIRLMGNAEAQLPDAVTKEIALPESVPEDSAAVLNAQRGLDQANEARTRRETGLATAEQARERGAGMAEQARENRETRGRSQDRPERPAVPERPNPPGPPGN